MWRPVLTVPSAALSVALLVSSVSANPVTNPSQADLLAETETAAELALEFDPWTITEQELLDAQTPLDVNLLTQQSSVGSAEADRDQARDLVDEAMAVRLDAQADVDENESLLQAFAIGTFMLSDPELDPNPSAQQEAARRQAPLDTVTTNVIADHHSALLRLDLAEQDEREARQDLLRAASHLQTRKNGVADAEALIETYWQIVADRQDEIDLRTEEVLELNDEPELTRVRGFRVNVGLAAQLNSLLTAAEADGIILGGWGHRPVDDQILLRLSHCGDSGYAMFDMPAGKCSPPTARPGHSQHELGLAVDFTENGAILNSGSPAFLWLQEHGAEYGFFNLPSEAWHWSTTGH